MIKLNIYAMRAHGQSISRGEYSENSSGMAVILKETKAWVKLHQAQIDSKEQPEALSRFEGYTLREEAAAEVIVSMIEYLQHIGCKDIEGLIRRIVEQ